MRARKLSSLLAAGGLILGAAAAAPAGADPKGESFELPCDNGQTYTVVVSEHGNEEHSKNDFTPAHRVDGTQTLIPLSFGEFTGTITDASGNVVDSFSDPATFKGQAGKNARNTVTCSLTFSETFVDPTDGMTYTFTGSGTVTGFVTPPKGA